MIIAMLGQKRIPSREGGVEVVVEELSTRMVKRGHQVTCYNRSGKSPIDKKTNNYKTKEFKGVKIKRVATINKKGLAAMTASFSATLCVLFSKADVVHYHAEGPCAWMWIIKWFSKKRIIATIHGLDWKRAKWGKFSSKYIKYGERTAVKYADEIIVLSKGVQEYFEKEYNRKTILIPNGVSKPRILSPKTIKEKYQLTQDSYILFLGRIVPEKGIHYLIKAYKQVSTDKKLVIAGDSSDTDTYYKELKEMTDNDSNIIFTGFVQGKELEELYSNCYIYVLPSDLEGMPLSLLEAMSYGNCCLTSNIEECSSVIEDKGRTFKKSDINDLKNIIQKLCDNPQTVKLMKKEAQEFVLSKYNWDDVTERTLKTYENRG